jgi:hypothetical protein
MQIGRDTIPTNIKPLDNKPLIIGNSFDFELVGLLPGPVCRDRGSQVFWWGEENSRSIRLGD